MAELNTLSNIAADNDAAVPEGAPEGWTGSQVNNVVRELMGKLYRYYEAPEWLEITYRLAPVGVKVITKTSNTLFKIVGCDARTTASGNPAFAAGRRIRLYQGASTFDGTVTAASFSAGDTDVTVVMDGGTIPATIDFARIHALASVPAASYTGIQAPRGYLFGATLSRTATVDITIAAGQARSSDNTTTIALTAALVKKIDAAWVAGSAVGGRSGALTNATWYHVFLIYNPTTLAVDAGFDTSLTATNLLAAAAGFTKFRRIGSVFYVDGASFIRDFFQLKDRFYWKTPILDFNAVLSTVVGAPSVITLSVPLGVRVVGLFNIASTGLNGATYLYSPDLTNVAPSMTVAPLGTMSHVISGGGEAIGVQAEVSTNASSQIHGLASTGSTVALATLGWIDPLGE